MASWILNNNDIMAAIEIELADMLRPNNINKIHTSYGTYQWYDGIQTQTSGMSFISVKVCGKTYAVARVGYCIEILVTHEDYNGTIIDGTDYRRNLIWVNREIYELVNEIL